MARGAEGKLRKKNEKKEARAAEAARLLEESQTGKTNSDELDDSIPMPPGMNSNVEKENAPVDDAPPAAKKKKKKTVMPVPSPPSESKKIKTLPLVLLVLLTGSTVLPALIYAGDWMGNMVQRHHVLGAIGHKLGIGATPKKRVMSFYEKHDPEKIESVPHIMAKYYGDYPKLVKRLERRYQDYGYFKDWEQDEAPMKLAMEKLEDTYVELGKVWMQYAPSIVQTGARNARNNFKVLHRKGKKIWKKQVWPVLEPIFGVPEGSDAQKRKDARESRGGKTTRKKKKDYRDDEEM